MIPTAISFYLYLILFSLAFFFVFTGKESFPSLNEKRKGWVLPCLIALVVRLILALFTKGYATDMNCWSYWSSRMADFGPWNFYSEQYFCDYPPGYLYILGILGVFNRMMPNFEGFLLRLPAILFDVVLVKFLYRKSEAEGFSQKACLTVSLLYALSPAVFVNSGVWGQVDSILTLFLILFLFALKEEKYIKSAALFSLSVLIKPQALLLSPVILLTLWEKRKMNNFGRTLLYAVLAFLGVFFALSLPFIILKEPLFIFNLYKSTLSSYPYASLNAFNLFTLLGANGVPVKDAIFGISYSTLGNIGIGLSVLVSSFIFIKGKDKSKFFYAAALLIFGVFMLGAKMHERYLFPVIAFLFLSYILRQDKRILILTGAVSLLHFLNVSYIYVLAREGIYYALSPDSLASLLSFLLLISYSYAVYLGISLYGILKPSSLHQEEKSEKITKKDGLIMVTATILYGVLAFTNLGNAYAPKTYAPSVSVADFGQEAEITSASLYKGIGDVNIHFSFSEDGENWSEPLTYEGSPCFKWENYAFSIRARYAKVEITGKEDVVYEAAFWNGDARVSLSSDSTLFDEQEMAEKENLYTNSTYFDEIYHARTAYEHIEYIPHYETTHPPLGKHIIGLGIRLFGMNPFGWRFMGTLFGILMLPLVYLFAKRLTKSTFLSAAAICLLAFDFMHFSQTRIATIDSFPVFFILLMYYFMYLFYEKADSLPLHKVLLFLGFSGLSFGLAISSKWIGFYGGAGLAILFFISLFLRQKKKKDFLIIFSCCILFFILIPFIIYYINYIPIHIADNAENHFVNFINYQKHMFSYHSELKADHPFGSLWYTWPFVIRPIWYYGNEALGAEGLTSSIVGMGNPLLWYISFFAVLVVIFMAAKNIIRKSEDRRPLFISIGYLSQLVPWMFVTRVVFIYHYFASLPFALLGLLYVFEKFTAKSPKGRSAVILFIILCGILFFAFYPVISGFTVPRGYVLSCLTWFKSWILGY